MGLINGSYINIQSWMVTELGLKGNELLVYAVIYGFCQDGTSRFKGSRKYLAEWTNSTVRGVQKCLNGMVEKGFLGKEISEINNIKFCEYYTILPKSGEQEPTKKGGEQSSPAGNKVHGGGEQSSLGVGNSVHRGRELSSPNNIEYNIDNNIEYNIDNNIEYTTNVVDLSFYTQLLLPQIA